MTKESGVGYTGKREAEDPYLKGRRDALAELRSSGGVSRSVVGIQVMYCLPDGFINAYEELWDKATSGAIGAVSGKGVEQDKGSGKAKGKANGIVLGSQTAQQASGGGKRYRTPTDLLGNDRALVLKTAVDRELADVAMRIVGELAGIKRGVGKVGEITPKCKGPGCGRFMKKGWRYCPVCGWERD